MTREMGRFAPQHGIKVNALMPGGSSRLTAQNEALQKIADQYLQPEKIAPFVVLLSSDECPISGETFSVCGGVAARVTLCTFTGSVRSTAGEWQEDWDNVMGKVENVQIPNSTAEYFARVMNTLTGNETATLTSFGVKRK